MKNSKIKKIYNGIFPTIERIAFETIKGYATGCLLGVLTPSKDSLIKTMHKCGKDIAKVNAAYTTCNIALEKIRKKDCIANKVISGAIAGSIGSKHGILPGAILFGGAFGLFSSLEKDTNMQNK